MVLEKILKNARSAIAIGLIAASTLGAVGCITEQPRKTWEQEWEQQNKNQQQLSKNQRHFFACNYINNGDSLPYVGIKNIFSSHEPLILVNYDPFVKAGDLEKVDIYSPAGKIIAEDSKRVLQDGISQFFFQKGGDGLLTIRSLLHGSKYGNYVAVWSLNNQAIGKTDFAIIP